MFTKKRPLAEPPAYPPQPLATPAREVTLAAMSADWAAAVPTKELLDTYLDHLGLEEER